MIPVSNRLTHSMFALLNLTLGFLFISRQVDLRPRTVRRDAERLSKLEHEPSQSPHPSPGVQLRGGNRQIRTTPPSLARGVTQVIAGAGGDALGVQPARSEPQHGSSYFFFNVIG